MTDSNTVNALPRTPKKAYPRTVIVLGLIVLAILAVKHAPTAAAGPVDEYNDGLKTVVCQMFDSGQSYEAVLAEWRKSFAAVDAKAAAAGLKPADHEGFIRRAVAERCPEHVAKTT